MVCKMRQERLADALAAQRRKDKQIFQIDTGPAAEGREVDEPGCKAGRIAIPFGDLAEQSRIVGEQRGVKISFGSFELAQQFLVLRKVAHQGEDKPGLTGARATDREGHSIAHTATAALMCGCGS